MPGSEESGSPSEGNNHLDDDPEQNRHLYGFDQAYGQGDAVFGRLRHLPLRELPIYFVNDDSETRNASTVF
jgi:hypothetical protein